MCEQLLILCLACACPFVSSEAVEPRPPTITRQKRSTAIDETNAPLWGDSNEIPENSIKNESFNAKFSTSFLTHNHRPHGPVLNACGRALSAIGPQSGGHTRPSGRP